MTDRLRRRQGYGRRTDALAATLLIACLAAQALTTAAGAQGLALQLDVSLNGQPVGLIASFTELSDGRIASTAAELGELGLKTDALGPAHEGLVILNEVPGLAYHYNSELQAIDIRVGDAGRTTAHYSAAGRDAAGKLDSGYGAVVNYAAFAAAGHSWNTGQDSIRFDGASVILDHRLYSPAAILKNSVIVGSTPSQDVGALRLETNISATDRDLMVTGTAGDVITGGLAWTRPVRMGGVQLRRNFDVRPDLVTMPLPEFSGSAVVPSTVDIYVNNVKAYSQQVNSGPFTIDRIPVVSGQGDTRMVVRDATGHETETTGSFSTSADLLRPGIVDYSFDAGFMRKGYGEDSLDYDEKAAGSASLRLGLTNSVTLESHVESTTGLINGGLGFSAVAGPLGQIAAAFSSSTSDRGAGAQIFASFDTQWRGINFSAGTTRTFGDYADLAFESGLSAELSGGDLADLKPYRALDRIAAGITLPDSWGSLGVAAIHVEDGSGDQSYFVSTSYSRTLPQDAFLAISAFAEMGGDDNMGLGLDYSHPLGTWGEGAASSAIGSAGDTFSLRTSKSRGMEDGSLGWRMQARNNDTLSADGQIFYRTPYADLDAALATTETGLDATAYAEGALAMADGHVFAGRRVDDAFAIVDVGHPGVAVYLENRLVGHTAASGRLMVPGLHAYESNKISIETRDLPLDVEITNADAIVVPMAGGGAVVKFGTTDASQSAIVIFRDVLGGFIPPGTEGTIQTGGAFVVGYDGQAYIEELAHQNTATLTLLQGTCSAQFQFERAGGPQTVIKDVVCK